MPGFLLTILLFGLFIEVGTGIALWVIDFWNTTIFSFILLHLFVGLILWIPLLFYVFPHSLGEIGFKFFGFLPPKPGPVLSKGRKDGEDLEHESGAKRESDRLYYLSAIILLLLLFLSFVLGSYLTVVGVPQQRDWVLQVHIFSGLVAFGLLVFHLRKPIRHIEGRRLGLLTLFFYSFLGGQAFLKSPLMKRMGFLDY